MRPGNILLCVSCALWAALLWLGINLVEGVTAQNVQGYPNLSQRCSLIGIPAVMVLTLLWSVIRFNLVVGSQRVLRNYAIVSLVFLWLYFISLGGGV